LKLYKVGTALFFLFLFFSFPVNAQKSNYERNLNISGKEHKIKIGNFHQEMPYSICIIIDDKTGFVIDPVWNDTTLKARKKERDVALVVPGTASPDYSYFSAVMKHNGANVNFIWGRKGAGAVQAMIWSDKETQFKLRLTGGWYDFHNSFIKTSDGFKGYSITPYGEFIPVSFKCSVTPDSLIGNYDADARIVISLKPEKKIFFTAGTGELAGFDKIEEDLIATGKDYEAKRASANGEWGDFLKAITDNTNNSRLYSSDNGRIVHACGRGWWLGRSNPDQFPYFVWDFFFQSMLASLEDPEGAYNTIRGILSFQNPEGFVPSWSHWFAEEGNFMSTDRSMPPVGSLCVWKIYERWKDKEFLKEVYPKLLKWHKWWHTARDGNKNGLLEWGSEKEFYQGAQWETGWDDNVHYENVEMAGSHMQADAVDLNSLWNMDTEYLAKIARELGKIEDASGLSKEFREMNIRINENLWNEKLGLYCSRRWGPLDKDKKEISKGEFLTRITPMNFYPLISGAPSKQQAEKALNYLYRPDKFWGEWIIPTVTYDDPVWKEQGYWHGQIWPPANYLLWQGILRYADSRHKGEYAQKSVDLFMRNWNGKRICGENYKSTDGSLGNDPHYLWGALLCQIGLEALIDIDKNFNPVIRKNIDMPEKIVLKNLPAGGKKYNITVDKKAVKIEKTAYNK